MEVRRGKALLSSMPKIASELCIQIQQAGSNGQRLGATTAAKAGRRDISYFDGGECNQQHASVKSALLVDILHQRPCPASTLRTINQYHYRQ
jgi:hypothetical protein